MKNFLFLSILSLLSFDLLAQDAVVHNFTSCDMTVTVYGRTSCGPVDCSETAVVPANSTVTITLPCPTEAVSATVTAACTTSPDINLNTTFCSCGVGSDYDSGSFTVMGWTVYAGQLCTGSDLEIKIWD